MIAFKGSRPDSIKTIKFGVLNRAKRGSRYVETNIFTALATKVVGSTLPSLEIGERLCQRPLKVNFYLEFTEVIEWMDG